MSPLRILVTGSRDFGDHLAIQHALMDVLITKATSEPPVLVHGGCPTGADWIADQLWHEWRMSGMNLATAEVHPADWKRRGRAAGPVRNAEMVAAGADVVLAFPLGPSPGTRGCVRLARAAGIPVIIHEGGPDWPYRSPRRRALYDATGEPKATR